MVPRFCAYEGWSSSCLTGCTVISGVSVWELLGIADGIVEGAVEVAARKPLLLSAGCLESVIGATLRMEETKKFVDCRGGVNYYAAR
jgi:hypothetical protein